MSNFNIRTRLFVGYGLLVMILILSAFFAVLGMNALSNDTKNLYMHPMATTNAILQADGNLIRMHRGMKDVALARTPEDIEKAVATVNSVQKMFFSNMESVKKTMVGDPKLVDDILQAEKFWQGIRERVIAFARAGNPQAAGDLTKSEGAPAVTKTTALISEVIKMSEAQGIALYEESEKSRSRSVLVFAVLNIVAILITLGVGLYIANSITRPLETALKVAQSVADGDLTTQFATGGRDETGRLLQAMRAMQESLSKLVKHVRETSESVSIASSEISEGNHDLSQRTESQASALQQTSSSMTQLGATVKQNSENAKAANQLAQTASSVAVQGGEVVAEVVNTMKGINESSKKIADIISVIDSIAFQTNILALNAAVEAARAGEQGRGFAVVAAEVRSLAGRSAEAAKEIKSLISTSVERVEQGSHLVNQAGNTMTEVVGSIRRVTDIMAEINAASVEQRIGVDQVGMAVTQMDNATQQNAALVEEMAAAASSLKTQSADLVHSVSVFKVSGTALRL